MFKTQLESSRADKVQILPEGFSAFAVSQEPRKCRKESALAA